MKNVTVQVFVIFGVVFLILILLGIYFFATDPYGIKPLIFGDSSTMESNKKEVSGTQYVAVTSTSSGQVASSGFELSNAQVDALVKLGIDPATVPSSISAEQEKCFVGVLGEGRVGEIKAGAVPNAIEFLKAKSCL